MPNWVFILKHLYTCLKNLQYTATVEWRTEQGKLCLFPHGWQNSQHQRGYLSHPGCILLDALLKQRLSLPQLCRERGQQQKNQNCYPAQTGRTEGLTASFWGHSFGMNILAVSCTHRPATWILQTRQLPPGHHQLNSCVHCHRGRPWVNPDYAAGAQFGCVATTINWRWFLSYDIHQQKF